MYSYAIKVYEIVIYLYIFILKKEWETTLEKKNIIEQNKQKITMDINYFI